MKGGKDYMKKQPENPSDNGMSLKEILMDIQQNQKKLIEEKKAKKWSLPWKARVGKGKLKQGYITVAYINGNKEVEFIRVPISEGAAMIKDAPYLATSEYMLTHKGKPMIIINSESVEPYSPAKHIDEAERQHQLQLGYRILLNKMKSEVIKPKKPIPWGIVLGGLAVIGILFYMMSNGGLPNLKLT
jgi:predicted porin